MPDRFFQNLRQGAGASLCLAIALFVVSWLLVLPGAGLAGVTLDTLLQILAVSAGSVGVTRLLCALLASL
jgi:hypothetical protein